MRTILAVMFAVATLIVPAPAVQSESALPSAAAVPPCRATGVPDALWVQRVNEYPQNFLTNARPFDQILRSTDVVKRLYSAICTAYPADEHMHCGADLGVVYGLDFSADSTQLVRAWVSATGCRTMTFGQLPHRGPRFAAPSDFWPLLAAALHLPQQSLFPRQAPAPVIVTVRPDRIDYADHALARITIRIRNTSRHTVRLTAGCSVGNPMVLISNDNGRVVYPPGVSGVDPLLCATHTWSQGPAIAPRQTLIRRRYAVMDGREFTAVVFLGPYASEIDTSPDGVGWGLGRKPEISLATHPALRLVLTPRQTPRGPLLYTDGYRCSRGASGAIQTSGTGLHWRHVWGTVITPQIVKTCRTLLEFHMTAGWLDQPVATVDYVKHSTSR